MRPPGPGLPSDQLHAENLAGEIGGFVGRTRQLDAASLAAAACVDLCFDDDDVDMRSSNGAPLRAPSSLVKTTSPRGVVTP